MHWRAQQNQNAFKTAKKMNWSQRSQDLYFGEGKNIYIYSLITRSIELSEELSWEGTVGPSLWNLLNEWESWPQYVGNTQEQKQTEEKKTLHSSGTRFFFNLQQNDGKRRVWTGKGMARDPKHTTSSVKRGGSAVTARACMTASGTGFLVFTDYVTADRSSRVNSKLYRLRPAAHIDQSPTTKATQEQKRAATEDDGRIKKIYTNGITVVLLTVYQISGCSRSIQDKQ